MTRSGVRLPSAPPNPCSTRVWTGSGEKCDTALCHYTLLKSAKRRVGTTVSRQSGCCTSLQHQRDERPSLPSSRSSVRPRANPPGLILRGATYYLRLKVPRRLSAIMGRTHVWKSLGTGYRAEAIRQARLVAGEFEERLRAAEGRRSVAPCLVPKIAKPPIITPDDRPRKTVREVLDRFRADPARHRTRKTDLHYANLTEMVVGLWGESRAIHTIDREACRELLDTLRWLPSNAAKRFPKLSVVEASRMAKEKNLPRILTAASVNGYMSKFRAVMNFAANEEWIDRNPAKGLQVVDQVSRRDKRNPFSNEQLRLIFDAPLYRGCVDDWHGYAMPGLARPKRGRFWVPLIALFSGMRLNEICQLDVADLRRLDDVDCFFVTAGPSNSENDKRLKTLSSERFIPVHPILIEIGFMTFVEERRRVRAVKLFSELQRSSTGYYSDPFSKWFRRFLQRAGASQPKTCFHSFRHCYRDAMREANIEHGLAHALGGWSVSGGKDGSEVSALYGRGYRPRTMFEAVSKITYPELDLSHLVDEAAHDQAP